MKIKLLIAGSRSLNTKHKDAMHAILDGVVKQYALDIDMVISGNARGPDRWGEDWAKKNNIHVEQYIPDWEKKGKGAGMLRNTEMVSACDAAFIMWDGASKGTVDTITKIKDSTKPFWLARASFILQSYNILTEEEKLEARAKESGIILPGG